MTIRMTIYVMTSGKCLPIDRVITPFFQTIDDLKKMQSSVKSLSVIHHLTHVISKEWGRSPMATRIVQRRITVGHISIVGQSYRTTILLGNSDFNQFGYRTVIGHFIRYITTLSGDSPPL